MTASYPTTAKSFATREAGTKIKSEYLNDIQVEVTAIAAQLIAAGVNIATVTPTANAVPKADAAGKLAVGWMPRLVTLAGLNDDTATNITPPNSTGFLFIRRLGGANAILAFDAVAGTAYCALIVGTADVARATGVLIGTTDADAKLTISAHTDGKIYIENRLGATIYLGYYCI